MIEFEDVHRYYGARPAVSGLSFCIERGSSVGLLGLNGAGKSTTLRMLAGVSLPTRGRVRIDGQLLGARSHAVRARIGYLPDRAPLYDEMEVSRYLAFAARLRGLSGAKVARAVATVLESCGLESAAHEPIARLSHGFRQRVGIAQAVVHGPSLLVLDEPSQGLDPAQNLAMRRLVKGLSGAHTVVLSTHQLADIRDACERVLLIHQGRLLAEGTERELTERFGQLRGHKLRVLVRASQGDAERALAGLLGVRVGLGRASGDELELELEAERDVRADVSRALVTASVPLLALEARGHGLEQLFVKLGEEAA